MGKCDKLEPYYAGSARNICSDAEWCFDTGTELAHETCCRIKSRQWLLKALHYKKDGKMTGKM